ncbi:hypothetical protein HAZT_HAZT004529 [Hyalella azteca]|uniref:Uncharacterized protein n=1 Tax=Hyalella azteca TaxID=294128 RepID=A0A6A0HA80_HYAAZ|nr:hypothetical protein HAZT_HAZT004529 [Hyalella azteca]
MRGHRKLDASCTIELPDRFQDIFRPVVDCAMCRNVTHVDKVARLSPQLFEQRRAHATFFPAIKNKNSYIDHVGKRSWQAQIRGSKTWTLEPPPECYFQCQTLSVTVHPGNISK